MTRENGEKSHIKEAGFRRLHRMIHLCDNCGWNQPGCGDSGDGGGGDLQGLNSNILLLTCPL